MTSPNYQVIEIPTCFSQARQVEEDILEYAVNCHYSEEDLFALRLSLEEALTNAIRHGNKEKPDKRIVVRHSITPERIDIYIADQGKGFDPNGVPDPTADENLALPSGRGIMLMRAYMNVLEYNSLGNEFHMVKYRSAV